MNREQDCVATYNKTWMLKDLLSDNSQEYDDDKLLECFKSIMGTGLYFYGKHIFILFISALIVIWILIELYYLIALFLFYFHWLIQFISYY